MKFIGLLIFSLIWHFANASTYSKAIESYELHGKATYRFFLIDVYVATLMKDPVKYMNVDLSSNWENKKNILLQLDYKISAKGKDIADRSMDEMKKQSELTNKDASSWLSQMTDLFPDVKPGDSITGIYNQLGHTEFYFNQTYLGSITSDAFSRHFFRIWLSDDSSSPKFTKKLLTPSNI